MAFPAETTGPLVRIVLKSFLVSVSNEGTAKFKG